jgi:hypothetical protein
MPAPWEKGWTADSEASQHADGKSPAGLLAPCLQQLMLCSGPPCSAALQFLCRDSSLLAQIHVHPATSLEKRAQARIPIAARARAGLSSTLASGGWQHTCPTGRPSPSSPSEELPPSLSSSPSPSLSSSLEPAVPIYRTGARGCLPGTQGHAGGREGRGFSTARRTTRQAKESTVPNFPVATPSCHLQLKGAHNTP